MTYNQAIEKLGHRQSKKIGNNTYLCARADGVALRLHQTDILLFKADGTTHVFTGGWRTATTKSRLNDYLPLYGITQKNHTWFWPNGVMFHEGDFMDAIGNIFRADKTAYVLRAFDFLP